MDSGYYKSDETDTNTLVSTYKRLERKLREYLGLFFFGKKMDDRSDGQIVKKQLRCTISSCFDKNNICCKTCDIKKCRYKCNFMDKEVCEHQQWD